MNIKQGLFGIVGTFMGCNVATAGDMGQIISFQGLHPVVSLKGGYASINAGGNTQRFIGTDSDVFTYTNSGSAKNTGFIAYID